MSNTQQNDVIGYVSV